VGGRAAGHLGNHFWLDLPTYPGDRGGRIRYRFRGLHVRRWRLRDYLRLTRSPQWRDWGLLILEGVVDLAAGVIAILWPAITLVALVWIVAIWAIVSGALMLAAAFSLNLDYGRWWLALGGIASTVFGILLIIEPLIGAVVLTLWIGAYAVVFGVLLLVLGFQLHSKREAQLRKAPAAAKKA
jgi:hypothetical protein